MTLNETKLVYLKAGFRIIENTAVDVASQQIALVTIMQKIDSDGAEWTTNYTFLISLYGSQKHKDVIRELASNIEKGIFERHAANPDTCEHNKIVINGKVYCTKCMANNFGADLTTNANVSVN